MESLISKIIEIQTEIKGNFKIFLDELNIYNNTYYCEEINDDNPLKQKETQFDKLFETIQRNNQLLSYENSILNMINQLCKLVPELFMICKNQKEILGSLNNKYLESMRKNESELSFTKRKVFSKNEKFSERMTRLKRDYDDYQIETEQVLKLKKQKEEEKRKREEIMEKQKIMNQKISKLQSTLTEKEIEQLEEITERSFEKIIFDSRKQSWKRNDNEINFYKEINKQRNLLFYIQTETDQKFGCFINAIIENDKVDDKNCFLFNIEGNSVEKYTINESIKAMKIYDTKNENLIEFGNGDILIKKEEYKSKCSCKQRSFNYNGKSNVFIGNKKTFSVKNFYVYQLRHKFEEKEELEMKFLDKGFKNTVEKLNNENEFKIAMYGENEVGKTTIVNYLCYNYIEEDYIPTPESTHIEINFECYNCNFNLNFFDECGSDLRKQPLMATTYIHGEHENIHCFVSSAIDYRSCKFTKSYISQYDYEDKILDNEQYLIFIIITHMDAICKDSSHSKEDNIKLIKDFADEHNIKVLCCNCFEDGDKIRSFFCEILKDFVTRRIPKQQK